MQENGRKRGEIWEKILLITRGVLGYSSKLSGMSMAERYTDRALECIPIGFIPRSHHPTQENRDKSNPNLHSLTNVRMCNLFGHLLWPWSILLRTGHSQHAFFMSYYPLELYSRWVPAAAATKTVRTKHPPQDFSKLSYATSASAAGGSECCTVETRPFVREHDPWLLALI